MKRFVSLALVLAIVLVSFVACGIVIPVGTYADSTGTSIIEVGEYDESAKSGTMRITNTINTDLVYEGTYTLSKNEADVSSIVTFTTTDGQVMEFVYDITLDVMQDLDSLIAYYGPNYVETTVEVTTNAPEDTDAPEETEAPEETGVADGADATEETDAE